MTLRRRAVCPWTGSSHQSKMRRKESETDLKKNTSCAELKETEPEQVGRVLDLLGSPDQMPEPHQLVPFGVKADWSDCPGRAGVLWGE